MKSKAHIGRHPIHPMLVAIPIGLWVFAWVADIFYFTGINSNWRLIAGYCLAGGCVGGLLAAIPGLIDYFFIENSKARKIATWHMVINILLVVTFFYNFYLRYQRDFEPAGMPFGLSTICVILLGVSGWLGGDLIYVHKVGVVEDEGPNNQRRPQ